MRLIFLLLSLVLSGCAGHNQSKKLLANIEAEVKKAYDINSGPIIAKYDLAGIGGAQCLYFKDYANVINSTDANQRFIRKMLPKISKKHLLEARARKKLSDLKNNLMLLNDKYSILSSADIRKLSPDEKSNEGDVFANLDDSNNTNSNPLKELGYVDHLAQYVPIFFPQGRANLTSPFGMRKHPISKQYKLHSGADFVGPKKAPVYAAADGHVFSAHKQAGYGNVVTIIHGHHFKTKYAHLCKMLVKKGDRVIRGQKIGLQGCSGNSTAEHLHFEIIFNDKVVNPMDFVEQGYRCQR